MVKSETRQDPSLKIRARDDEHKNPRPRRKKWINAKTRFRDSPQRIQRFRDRRKICRDPWFSKDHSPPLILVALFSMHIATDNVSWRLPLTALDWNLTWHLRIPLLLNYADILQFCDSNLTISVKRLDFWKRAPRQETRKWLRLNEALCRRLEYMSRFSKIQIFISWKWTEHLLAFRSIIHELYQNTASSWTRLIS